jgi:hypothetical protein
MAVGGGCWLLLTRKLREELFGEGTLKVWVEEVAGFLPLIVL